MKIVPYVDFKDVSSSSLQYKISKLGASYFLETPVDIPLLTSLLNIKSYVIAKDKSRAREKQPDHGFCSLLRNIE